MENLILYDIHDLIAYNITLTIIWCLSGMISAIVLVLDDDDYQVRHIFMTLAAGIAGFGAVIVVVCFFVSNTRFLDIVLINQK